MAKLENYNGSIKLIDGLSPFGEDYPLMDAHYVQTGEDGTRLDEELADIKESVLNAGDPIYTDTIVSNKLFYTTTIEVNQTGYVRTNTGDIHPDYNARNSGYIYIRSADVLYLKTQIGSNGYAVAFFDAAKSLLSDISILGTGSGQIVNLNLRDETYSQAVYAIVSSYNYKAECELRNPDSLENHTNKKTAYISIEVNQAGYVTPGGWFNTSEPAHRSKYVYLKDFDVLYLKTQIGSNGYAVAFFDAAKSLLSDISILGTGSEQIVNLNLRDETYSQAVYAIVSSYNYKAECELRNQLDAEIEVASSAFASFAKFGIIGDSLSVGHTHNSITNEPSGRNIYYSWGQYMARRNGNTCLNFGHTGVTSKSWFTVSDCYNEFKKEENRTQCYIVALGANDAGNLGNFSSGLGTTADIGTENDSFYGWFSKIIGEVSSFSPEAKIFILTLPYPRNQTQNVVDVNAAIRYIADSNISPNVYLVDLSANFDGYFKNPKIKDNLVSGHYTAAGYEAISRVIEMAISSVMCDNISDFMSIPFIPFGTNNVVE